MTTPTLPPGSMGLPLNLVQRPCAAGIDIRPNSWDVGIGDVIQNKRGIHVPRLVFYGKLADEDQVEFILRQYGVICDVKDSRPEAHLAERLTKKLSGFGIRSYRASYLTTPGDIKVQANDAEKMLRLERTMTLDDLHYAVMVGGLALPQNFREICGGAFDREMQASTRVATKVNGREWWTWTKGGDDHAFHCLNYLMVAMHVGKLLHFGSDATMGASDGIVLSRLSQNLKLIDPATMMDQDDDPDDGIITFTA